MTRLDIPALRALAEKATSGPWRNGHDPCHYGSPEVTDDKTFSYYVPDDNNAKFIAAFHPAQCLALLDEVERLRALLKEACDIAAQSTHAVAFADERRARHARISAIRKELPHAD